MSRQKYTSFKRASELGITSELREAFIWTLKLLERGVVKNLNPNLTNSEQVGPLFDMSTGIAKHPCGTACCIAGWSAIRLAGGSISENGKVKFGSGSREIAKSLINDSSEHVLNDKTITVLDRLFVPSLPGKYLSDLTIQEGAKVLRTYLKTGRVIWKQIAA